jgi:hypothetical protein
MITELTTINPFYAARMQPTVSIHQDIDDDKPVYAKLPRAPRNASPVPSLTSLYHKSCAGDYGSRTWPGNCGGNLIKDLLRYFHVQQCFDPMSGSGTCQDVCDELGIPCQSLDIHMGADACDPQGFSITEPIDFVWAHPAYWRMKLYADDDRDLSRSPTLKHFLHRYRMFIRNSFDVLQPAGRLAILMGDYTDKSAGFVPLTYWTKRIAFEEGFTQTVTDIIRFSHGNSSSKKRYRSSFIPGLHDVCMIFDKPDAATPGRKGE